MLIKDNFAIANTVFMNIKIVFLRGNFMTLYGKDSQNGMILKHNNIIHGTFGKNGKGMHKG